MLNSAHNQLYIKGISIIIFILGILFGPLTGNDSILLCSILGLTVWMYGKTLLIRINNQVAQLSWQDLREEKEQDIIKEEEVVEESQGETDEGEEGIILAFDAKNKPVRIPDLTSLGIGGKPGMGKTVEILWIFVQLVIKKAGKVKFLILDPHKPDVLDPQGESLAERTVILAPFYLKGPAENPSGKEGMLAWVQWLKGEVERRLKGGRKSWEEYIVVGTDEFAAIMLDDTLAKNMSEILEIINTQARKIGIFAIVGSPIWNGTRVDTKLRGSINNFLLFNMDANIARQIVQDSEIAKQIARLPKFHVVLNMNDRTSSGKVKMLTTSEIQNAIEPYLPGSEVMFSEAAKRYTELTVRAKLSHEMALLIVAKELYNGNEIETLQVLKDQLK